MWSVKFFLDVFIIVDWTASALTNKIFFVSQHFYSPEKTSAYRNLVSAYPNVRLIVDNVTHKPLNPVSNFLMRGNHMKFMVFDDRLAFIGGMDICTTFESWADAPTGVFSRSFFTWRLYVVC